MALLWAHVDLARVASSVCRNTGPAVVLLLAQDNKPNKVYQIHVVLDGSGWVLRSQRLVVLRALSSRHQGA